MSTSHHSQSSCCAPDGTCSSAKSHKPELYFLTKLSAEQLAHMTSTLEASQVQDASSDAVSYIKTSLESHIPVYFLRKLVKAVKQQSVAALLPKLKDIAQAKHQG